MKTPENYEAGIRHIENLNFGVMQQWLEAELRGKTHVLPGQADDFPVQAIVNHHLYLSLPAQKRLNDAVDALILEWRNSPSAWPELAGRGLLDLAGELRVTETKSKLQGLVTCRALSAVDSSLRPAVLRTIASLSSNDDSKFWSEVPLAYPEYAGMAFQVLARISPQVALSLLSRLPADKSALEGVARKLPDFVSKFEEPKAQLMILEKISESIASLPAESGKQLQAALAEEGFDLGEIRFPIPEEDRDKFVKQIIIFAQTIRPRNELKDVYAGV